MALVDEECGLCRCTIATGDCPHVAYVGEQAVVTRKGLMECWENLREARNRVAELEGEIDE